MNLDEFKKASKRLSHSLKENGLSVPHTKVLDMTARTYGYSDYNEFKRTSHQNGEEWQVVTVFHNADDIPLFLSLLKNNIQQEPKYRVTGNRLSLDCSHMEEPESVCRYAEMLAGLMGNMMTDVKVRKTSMVTEDCSSQHESQIFYIPYAGVPETLYKFLTDNVTGCDEDLKYIAALMLYVSHKNDIPVTFPLLTTVIREFENMKKDVTSDELALNVTLQGLKSYSLQNVQQLNEQCRSVYFNRLARENRIKKMDVPPALQKMFSLIKEGTDVKLWYSEDSRARMLLNTSGMVTKLYHSDGYNIRQIVKDLNKIIESGGFTHSIKNTWLNLPFNSSISYVSFGPDINSVNLRFINPGPFLDLNDISLKDLNISL